MILTDKGYFRIDNLEEETVNVWNGKEFTETIVKKTGVNQELIEIYFDDGTRIDCTKYHKFYIDDNNDDLLYDKDNKTDTGYVFVMKNGIRGQWNGQLINIKDGTIPFPAELLAPPYHEGVYKIFYKPVESAVSNQTPNTH
jgi:hypothetical protein